jgi:asparagine synthase (glutamine-hydrolysing)
MSGICAAWHRDDAARIATTLVAIDSGLASNAAERAIIHFDPAAGGGVAAHIACGEQDVFNGPALALACDADLLNAAELRKTAGAADGCGTGALLAALYEQYGTAFVQRLRGGFSVVVWDKNQRRLFAAVDAFGIKRLAWYASADSVLIATRADALRAATPPLTINPRTIANVLNFSSSLGPETIFKEVHRLAPGTTLIANDAGVRTDVFWMMQYGLGTESSEESLGQELEAVLQESVRVHATGVSPIGAFLSGGTDSSTVVGLLTRLFGEGLDAFSIGFQEAGFSELEYAAVAARAFRARHHTYLVTARDTLEALPHIVRSFDEPFGNSSAVATYFCARLAASAGVRTLLAGDGGDELFGGNERYAVDKIFESYFLLPAWLRRGVVEPAARLPLPVIRRRARGYLRRAHMRGVERMLSFQFLRTHDPTHVFEDGFLRALEDYTVLDIPARHYAFAPARDHLDRLLYVDMKITLADNDLPKVTCMSQLAGIRTRFPFLDRDIAEFSGRIPAGLKVNGFQKRYLFKRAFRRLLPREILQKKKHGFGIPVALWMRSDPGLRDLAQDTLRSSRALARGYFRRAFIEDLFTKHQSGTDTYYGDTLWTFLMLELWHRQVVDQPCPARP